ncbi:hypothetical protein R1sor_026345 [Riccia sorocarpa]|uniref:Endonuclease/exonuclease/phosphatase domain-containing protein n=1 Tax=Riccia sorocarpa TaxID=122646 RepID=A0ABD3GB55_9MARC
MAFWQQVREIITEEKWCLLGDFNNIEMPEDSKGLTVLVKGRDERLWRQMAIDHGLVDVFFCAVKCEGPRFTRMAHRRNRYDLSQLDRVYLTQGATWIDHMSEVAHLSGCVLSDHMPVKVEIQAWPVDGDFKPASYFKMNFYDLHEPEVMQRVKDQRLKQKREESSLRQEVVWRRAQMTLDGCAEDEAGQMQEALKAAEQKLKAQELYDARMWRIRSREKWLQEDEVPSRYFFAKLKSKWARESMTAVTNQEGDILTNRQEISDEVQNFFQVLYTAEQASPEQVEAREEMLSLIRNTLSPDVSKEISCRPEKAEIEEVVFSMKSTKLRESTA